MVLRLVENSTIKSYSGLLTIVLIGPVNNKYKRTDVRGYATEVSGINSNKNHEARVKKGPN